MKKLLRVIPSMNPAAGGPVQGIKNSIPWLARNGWTSEAVTLDAPDSSHVSDAGIRIHALGPGFSPIRYAPGLLPWLERNLNDFDAVTVHGLWLWPSLATWLAIQRLRRGHVGCNTAPDYSQPPLRGEQLPPSKIPPYFVMPHGMLDRWFQKAPGRRFKALRNTVYWKLLEHRVIRDAEALLFTCEREKLLARKTFHPYAPKGETVIGYGVNEPPARTAGMEAAFRKTVPSLPASSPYLLYLGRIDSKKGLDLLVAAYAHLLRRKSIQSRERDTPHLVIAGPGKETAFGKKILRLARDLECGEFIHFPGMLAGDSKWGAFHGCEAFALCSHQENFGIAVAEALSCGKPVLISESVNIWNEIVSAGAGYAGPDNPKGAVELLGQWAMTPPSRRDEMGRAALHLFKTGLHAKTAADHLTLCLESSLSD